ncbi:hypothetical protein V6Z12_A02G110600 [Gossypium hirsutum]
MKCCYLQHQKSSLPFLILGISNILIGAHCNEAMISEALYTIDTMNKRVITRYVSKAEDIVDTIIKRDIEQIVL